MRQGVSALLRSVSLLATAGVLMASPAHAAAQEAAGQASAASEPVGTGDIVVTAQRREQNLIDVPASISAFSGDTLRRLNVQSGPEIAVQVPNFSVSYERGSNSMPNFTLRGVRGDGLTARLNESSIAIYTDDVFLGDETGLNGALFDLERVEVLRGPQGTVFGKNTTGGLVHFISAKPTDHLSGRGSIQYGSDNEVIVEGAVSGSLATGIRARLAGIYSRNDGHYRNLYEGAGANGIERKVGDKDLWGLRGIVDIDLGERTMLRLIGAYASSNSQTTPTVAYGTLRPETTTPGPYTRANMCDLSRIQAGQCISDTQILFPGAAPAGPRKLATSITNLTGNDLEIVTRSRAITATLTHDFDWAMLTSVTNYINNRSVMHLDADGGATPSLGLGPDYRGIYSNRARQFSEELRLNGSMEAFDWVTGLFYYTDRKSNSQLVIYNNFGFNAWTAGAVKSASYALFGQIDARISPNVTFAIGGRYTRERREMTQAETYRTPLNSNTRLLFQDVLAAMPVTTTNNKDFTGKMSLTWEPSDNDTFYASYSRGIKGAGFNSSFTASSPIQANVALAGPVGQEVLDSFEIGSKNRFFGRALSINSAAFYYDFKGKQDQFFILDQVTNTNQQVYLNVGNARIYGIETEIKLRPDPHWDLSVSGGWLNTRITRSDVIVKNSFGASVALQGLPLSETPKWTAMSILAYHIPLSGIGEVTPQIEVRSVASKNASITNEPLSVEASRTITNARLFWDSEDGRFNAQVFVTNVFRTFSTYRTRDVTIGGSGKLITANAEGRLWGARLGYKF